MNRRLFFITLLMLFCSTVFGQEPYYEVTNVNAGDYTDNMPLIAKVSFDGAVQLSDQLEVGVFCGDQLRASLFTNYKLGNDYYVFNAVWGKTGEVFTFKVYDHRTKTEWYYNQEITVKGSKKTSLLFDILGYGTFDSPAVIDFKTPPYYIPNTDASNSMLMAALVQIDGVEQSNGNLELGAFINDTVRGSARVNYNVNGKMYAYMQVYGKYGQEVTFKLYDHDAKEEVRFVTVNTVNFNEDGYLNFSNPLTVNFRTRYAHFDGGAYAAYAANKPREHFSINLYDVYASQSLVVKVYHDETLLLTTTYRDYDLDDTQHTSPRYPVSTAPGKGLTVNNVVSGKEAGSWLNVWSVSPTVANVPNKFEVYVDGIPTDTYDGTQNPNAGFSSAENLKTYLGFDGVYKAASVTRGTDVTYYMTLAEAWNATQDGDIVTLYDNAELASRLDVTNKITLNLNGKNITANFDDSYGAIYVKKDAKLTIEGEGDITSNSLAIGTYGTVNIKGGNITTTGSDDAALYVFYYPNHSEGTANISGGSLNEVWNCGTLNVSGGQIDYLDTSSELNVTGGVITKMLAKDGSDASGAYEMSIQNIETTVPTVEVPEHFKFVEIRENVYQVVAKNYVAQTETGAKFETLKEAIDAANETVTLLQTATGAGVVIDKDITIDFATYTYTVNQAVGSAGTETLGFQILKGNTVTLKNGTLKSTTPVVTGKEVKMLIQNYANLTLTDMNLFDNTTHIQYALSNNSGTSNINGATSITTDAVAFDVYDYTAGGYALPTVNVNTTGKITGAIEVSESISNNLNISGGLFTAQIAEAWCADGFFPTEVEIDGNTYYTVHEGLLGSGTETDPFIIRSLGELKFFRDHVNAGKTTYNVEGVHVALAANIDMATEDWSVNIGDDCNKTFDGIFDGKGYTISNLNGTETAQKADGYVCTGLFGAIYGNAVIKNLTIENVNINTAEYTGNNAAAVVGFVYDDNGKTTTIENVTVKGDVNINASGVYGVGAIVGYSYEGGAVNIKNCKVVANEGSVITATSGTGAIIGYCAGRTTIDGCTVDNIDITGKGLVGGIAGITSISNTKNLTNNTVKNVNLTATKAEWVNSTAIAVGTMSGDGLTVANTIFENVNASRMVGSVYAEQPTYVVPAVEARIENKYYGTFDAALAAAQEGNTITILAPVVITVDKTYDLTGLTVAGENVYPIFRIQNNAEVTVKGEGTITNDDYVFVVGASDSSSAGNLTIENGTYIGETTVAQVTLGNLTIKGGRFSITDVEPYDYAYLINCKDANYTNGTADVKIYGGTFVGFDPENNAAEGAGTNFCADGYLSDDNGDGTYTVREGVYVAQVGDKKFESFDEAFAYAKSTTDNDAITILKTIVLSADQTIDFESIAVTSTVNPAFRITDGATVTVENGNMNTEDGGYNFILGASDGSSAGNLTIKSGKYHASTTVASVTKGNLVIEGGEFSATPYKGSYAYLINCIDANYTNGSAKVEIKGGMFHNWNPQDNAAEGTGTDFCHADYAATETAANVWTVLPAVAKIGEARFATLQDAINAVKNAETINIIAAEIAENVNIVQKEGLSFTIDGQIDNTKVQYTGTISIDGNGGYQRTETLTIKNINFYNEVKRTAQEAFDFIVAKSGQSHNVTVESCDFTDNYTNTKNYVKGAEVKEANNWKFVNCTANERMMNLLHYYGGSQNLVVNGGTVKAYYGIHIDSSVDGLFEGVAFESADRGFTLDGNANNTGEIVNTLKNVSFKNIDTPIFASIGTDQRIRVFNIEGNVTSENYTAFPEDERVKFVLTATDATLQAQEGLNVTTSVAGHIVDYADGKYYLRVPNYVAAIGEAKYESLQAAIDAAQDGDVIGVIEDHTYDCSEVKTVTEGDVLMLVENKNVTIDLNGKVVTVDVQNSDYSSGLGLIAAICANNAELTLKDSSEESTGKINVLSGTNNVYCLVYSKNDNTKLTIESGAYYLDKTSNVNGSLVYADRDNTTFVNGGDFYLGNANQDSNKQPWIFNTWQNGVRFIIVKGGTYNANPLDNIHGEGRVPSDKAVVLNPDGKYEVVDAVANIGAKGYASIADAVNAAQANETVTVIKAHKITSTAVVERDITIDFGGLEVTSSASPAIRIQGGANVTVKNGNMNTDNYNFILGASDGSSTGNLTIESGSYKGASSVASVTKGLLTINGGEFEANASQWGSTYLINCIDANYKDGSAKVEIKGGKFHQFNPENNAAEGAGTNFCATGYIAEKIECEHGDCYEVIEGVYVAQVGEVKYKTVAAAVAAATAGETVTLIANVTEDVTISKNLTIDGAGKNYTGNISVDNSVNKNVEATIKNVNFVDGTGYAITTNRIKSITVENCTVNNYSFLYANKSTPTVVVKNVTVDGGNYGFHWVYGTTATLENVTMTNVTNGLLIQNYASKTINLKNCVITTINIWERSGYSGVQTFNFEGANTVGTLSSSQYAKYVLAATDATLTATEGFDVTTTVDGYKVAYGDGKYYLKPCDYVAEIVGGAKYESLQAAIDEAVDDDEIDLIKSIYVTEVNNDNTTEILVNDGVSYRALYTVSGKSVTIDLNDNILYSTAVAADFMYNVFAVANGGHLTIKTDGLNGHGQVINEAASSVYSLLFCYDGTLTIESGNYYLKNGGNGRGMIYSQQDETVTVNGGKFILENVGELDNGSPWIFNASGQNTKNIIVNGGTFNDDILHQYYPFEVMAQKEKALQYNAVEELWTMVDAVAYVDEQHKSGNWYTNEVGFVTLEEAFAAAAKYNHDDTYVTTVTLLANVELSTYVTISKSVNLNLDQFNITRVDGTALYVNGEGIEVTINGEGTVSGTQAVYVDNGTVTINGGNYVGGYEAVYVINNGHAVINGGTFGAENDEDDTDFVLNEYDATRDVTTIAVYGGTFHGFNPENNAAEGANTNFCASGYGAVETATDSNIWKVVPMQGITLHPGWNWFSSYINITLNGLQNALAGNATIIKSQSSSFTSYSENGSWYGELNSLSIEEMYMIEMSNAHTLSLTGDIVDPSTVNITLKQGWNWIGYPFSDANAVKDVVKGVMGDNDQVKSHKEGFAEYFNGNWYGSLKTLKPGQGYMYGNKDGEHQFTYTIPGAKSELRANVTAENNRWVPASSQFVNNMTMVAMVDGVNADSYEVAAFVNGEVRGSARPIYIEPLDAYMLFLTIYGDEVEEMTFRYYDLTTGEEYALDDRINYSNDARVGSIAEPYIFRGTVGIGENAMTEINIYPNPTTTGSEVNLGSVCDTVEVFNALGVKIAEYTNVDTIDALETAGVYMIRIVNDNKFKYCRLIVK